ncbi:MAG: CxxC-x17-CxxC domain-containing protein [Candidatus Heimdallarchaeota archaeon]
MSNRNYGNRTMHKATCADCGSQCEVPFKPTEGRDVYCRDCYRNHRRY